MRKINISNFFEKKDDEKSFGFLLKNFYQNSKLIVERKRLFETLMK